MPRKIEIMDTTLRDGEQTAGVSFKVDEKLTIAKFLLIESKVDAIEVGSARVSEGEFNGIKKICKWAKTKGLLDKIEVLGLLDNNKSVDWICETGCRTLNLLCKGSLKHVTKQLRKTPEEHIKDINKTIDYAKCKGMKVNIYLEDFSNGIVNSKEYMFLLLDNFKGVNRVMLPDTLGIFDPEQTFKYCKEIINKYNYKFDFHAHNDYGLAVANSLAAVKAGATRIHTTVNGLGERTGNSPIASTIAAIHDHGSFKTNINEKKLKALSSLVESISGIRLSLNTPVVGENVFIQCCGIHADGDKKGNLYCSKLSPERFGGERTYALGKTSGKASIDKNLELLGIELDEESKKKVLKRVVELGDKKEAITISDLPYIVSDMLGEPLKHSVKLLNFSLQLNSDEKPYAEVVLEINKKRYSSKAEGDGQYDAFMKAIQKIYGKLSKKLPKLVDYTVRIPPGGQTDALVETVITWQNSSTFKTRGVDSDQSTAAIKATINMLNRI